MAEQAKGKKRRKAKEKKPWPWPWPSEELSEDWQSLARALLAPLHASGWNQGLADLGVLGKGEIQPIPNKRSLHLLQEGRHPQYAAEKREQ